MKLLFRGPAGLPASPAIWQLLVADRHPPEVVRERCSLIISRTQLFAQVLAVLTICWIAVDIVTIGWPLWGMLACCRLLAATVFFVLAQQRYEIETLNSAHGALARFVGVAVGFFLLTNIMFWLSPLSEQSIFAITTYFYTPFLFAAGISLFPLTLMESAVMTVPIFAVMMLSIHLLPALLGTISAPAILWRLLLMASIGAIAGMSQLRLLIDLIEQSALDKLTGTLNRKFGEQMLQHLFTVAVRNDRHLSLFFVDLDRFKSVNDRFGHEAGDAMLQRVAQSLRANLRSQDVVIRWGGEEFLVALPDTDGEAALNLVLRIGSSGMGLRPDGRIQTASIGLSERVLDKPADWARLVKLADERMYAAKKAGGNRFIGATGKVEPLITVRAISKRSARGRRVSPPVAMEHGYIDKAKPRLAVS
jgi:diguanylate cyclase (GGDEF)-like protein